jgi:hypothetical protein
VKIPACTLMVIGMMVSMVAAVVAMALWPLWCRFRDHLHQQRASWVPQVIQWGTAAVVVIVLVVTVPRIHVIPCEEATASAEVSQSASDSTNCGCPQRP